MLRGDLNTLFDLVCVRYCTGGAGDSDSNLAELELRRSDRKAPEGRVK